MQKSANHNQLHDRSPLNFAADKNQRQKVPSAVQQPEVVLEEDEERKSVIPDSSRMRSLEQNEREGPGGSSLLDQQPEAMAVEQAKVQTPIKSEQRQDCLRIDPKLQLNGKNAKLQIAQLLFQSPAQQPHELILEDIIQPSDPVAAADERSILNEILPAEDRIGIASNHLVSSDLDIAICDELDPSKS